MKINKLEALMVFVLSLFVFIIKKVVGVIFYPIAYLFYDWVMNGVVRQNYTKPERIFANHIKWFFWLFYDDDQVPQGAEWYQRDYCKCYCPKASWLNKFICAYRWSGWRNTMYNVNYVYLSTQSDIMLYDKSFGNYTWNKKLRSSNGDNGYQLVWFQTAKKQNRFIFSMAKQPFGIPFTLYFGWNPNFNGRFTIAGKFK